MKPKGEGRETKHHFKITMKIQEVCINKVNFKST